VFENRAPRWIFGLKRDEVTGVWRKLHNEELNDPVLLTKYYSSDKIKQNELGGAFSMARREVYTGFWWGDLRKGYHLEEPGVDGRMVLKWIFKKLNEEHGLN
jgi:hypothetical protein